MSCGDAFGSFIAAQIHLEGDRVRRAHFSKGPVVNLRLGVIGSRCSRGRWRSRCSRRCSSLRNCLQLLCKHRLRKQLPDGHLGLQRTLQ